MIRLFERLDRQKCFAEYNLIFGPIVSVIRLDVVAAGASASATVTLTRSRWSISTKTSRRELVGFE